MHEPHGNAVAEPERLRRRADFLHAAKGKRFHARGLTLQAAPRAGPAPKTGDPSGILPCKEASPQEAPPRFGFTVTRQSGGAVQRNRIRRRLKEALRLLKPLPALPSHDYVIVARPEALSMPFRTLQAEIMRALGKVDRNKTSPSIGANHRSGGLAAGGAGEASRKSLKGGTFKG